MGWTQAIFLAVIQGLTEFIPVSSSAHLVILPGFFSWQPAPLFYDVMVHFGTAISILLYFVIEFFGNRNISMNKSGALSDPLTPSLFKGPGKKSIAVWIAYIVLGTVPAAVIGFLFNDFFESFFSAPVYAASFLILTGFILFSADYIARVYKQNRGISWHSSLLIGIAQAVAIFPGISRSGATISAGIWQGISKETAARFSFVLGFVVISGTAAYELLKLPTSGLSADIVVKSLIGLVISAMVGFVSIKVLLAVLKRSRFLWFSIYCWAFGVGYLVFNALS
ncbi:MAG: undecaprenyl-diphosphate phosphatase [Actinobacteria bacterium]|nr:undecaprenyl-diphosphate phosphatase [Actinomycetota bacterium]